MTDVVRYEPTDSWVPMLGAVGDLATKVASTEFVGKGFRGKPASVAAAILTGRELNLGPMTSLRGLDVIDGRVSMSAQLMAAKIQGAGHRIDWIENTDKAAEVRIVRGDGLGEGTARWTMADAQRAGLAGKTNWAKYPRAMLKARALTECAGMVCADVLMGIEAGDAVDDAPARPAGGTTVVQVKTTDPIPDSPVGTPAAVEPGHQQPDTTASGKPGTSNTVVSGNPDPDPEPDPSASTAQLRKINAQLGDLERRSGEKWTRDQRRDFIRELAELPDLATAKDLTRAQASLVIERIDPLLAISGPEPEEVAQ